MATKLPVVKVFLLVHIRELPLHHRHLNLTRQRHFPTPLMI
jgi:hypothetical protein